MNNIERQLSNYREHFDGALARGVRSSASGQVDFSSNEQGETMVFDRTDSEQTRDASDSTVRSPWLITSLVAASILLVVVGGLFLVSRDAETSPGESASKAAAEPSQPSDESSLEVVVEMFAEAQNTGDIDAVMGFFSEESIVVGSSQVATARADGLEEIQAVQTSFLATTEIVVIGNVEVAGDSVSWDSRVTDHSGQEWCGAGHEAVIRNGSISSLTFSETPHCSTRSNVIERYVNAYGAGDIEAVMELYTEESVKLRHPFRARAEGLDEIRELETLDRDAAAESSPYVIANIEVVGNTVTWDHRWTNDSGQDWCSAGQSAVVEDGKIVSQTFSSAMSCDRRTSVVEGIVEAYNAGDVGGIMKRFTEDSVIIGHPLRAQDAEGLEEIRTLYISDLDDSAAINPLTISNVEPVGATVTWDQRWTSREGEDWCVVGQSALTSGSSVLSFTWAKPSLCAD